MKYLIVVIVVLVVGWLLLRARKGDRPPAAGASGPKPSQAMVECRHCGVHLPRAEALFDARGAFCSEAHRLAGPGTG